MSSGSEANQGFEYQHYVVIQRALEFFTLESQKKPIRIIIEPISDDQTQDIEIEYVDRIILEQIKKKNSYWTHQELIEVISSLIKSYLNHEKRDKKKFILRFSSNRSLSHISSHFDYFKKPPHSRTQIVNEIIIEALNHLKSTNWDKAEMINKEFFQELIVNGKLNIDLRLPSFGGWDLGDSSLCLREYLIYRIDYQLGLNDLKISNQILSRLVATIIRKSSETIDASKKVLNRYDFLDLVFEFIGDTYSQNLEYNNWISVRTPRLTSELNRIPFKLGSVLFRYLHENLIARIKINGHIYIEEKPKNFDAVLILKDQTQVCMIWNVPEKENNLYLMNYTHSVQTILDLNKSQHISDQKIVIIIFTREEDILNGVFSNERMIFIDLNKNNYLEVFAKTLEGLIK